MSPERQFEFVVALLIAVAVLDVAARRLRLPPAAALIAGGAAIAVAPGVPSLSLDPELVLMAFLPPLLMSGGWFTAWVDFRANLAAIGLLAIGAVAFTTAIVGIVAHQLVPTLPWAICFALGAVVSPPDAVAASAVLKRLSLPGRLTATLEGESLLNDASGLVLFRFAVAAALTGSFSALDATVSFFTVSVGGVALGWLAGRTGAALLARLRDSELAILVTLLLPSAAYILGEHLHVSGVLAVVTTGIILGRRQHAVLSADIRLRAQAFWSVLTYLLESALFVLIGLALRDVLAEVSRTPDALHTVWLPTAGVVGATIAARMVWIYLNWVGRVGLRAMGAGNVAPPSLAVATVLGWAGMRGVVTLMAALSLPVSLPGRNLILVSAFSVILITVLVQGSTLGPLISALGLSGEHEEEDRRRTERRRQERGSPAHSCTPSQKRHDKTTAASGTRACSSSSVGVLNSPPHSKATPKRTAARGRSTIRRCWAQSRLGAARRSSSTLKGTSTTRRCGQLSGSSICSSSRRRADWTHCLARRNQSRWYRRKSIHQHRRDALRRDRDHVGGASDWRSASVHRAAPARELRSEGLKSNQGAVALTVQIAASPAKIWSVVRHFQDVANWNSSLASSKLLSGKPGALGAEREVITADGVVVHEQLTELDEERRVLGYRMLSYLIPVTAQTNRISVAAGSSDHLSHVTFSAHFKPTSGAVADDVADMNGAAFIAAANGLGHHLGVDVHVVAVSVEEAHPTAAKK